MSTWSFIVNCPSPPFHLKTIVNGKEVKFIPSLVKRLLSTVYMLMWMWRGQGSTDEDWA